MRHGSGQKKSTPYMMPAYTQRGRAPRSGQLTFCGEPVLQDLTGGAKYPYCESACVRQDAAARAARGGGEVLFGAESRVFYR